MRLAGGSDAGCPSERKSAAAAARKSLGILPPRCCCRSQIQVCTPGARGRAGSVSPVGLCLLGSKSGQGSRGAKAVQEVGAGRVSGEAAKSLRSCARAPGHHPWYGQSHMTHSCRIKSLFHSKGQCKSLHGPLPLPGREPLCSSHFACPGEGCTDPPNGDSVPGNRWGPLAIGRITKRSWRAGRRSYACSSTPQDPEEPSTP